jgi:hypothetical protein
MWEENQKDAASKFFQQLASMAKEKKLPKGLKLERVTVDENARCAVCEWDVDDPDKLMEVARQFDITWKVFPATSPKVVYEHKGWL